MIVPKKRNTIAKMVSFLGSQMIFLFPFRRSIKKNVPIEFLTMDLLVRKWSKSLRETLIITLIKK